MSLSRRTLLAAAAATLAPPRRARAQPARFSRTADRARGLDQLHALIVAEDGTPVLAEAFRGPALDRASQRQVGVQDRRRRADRRRDRPRRRPRPRRHARRADPRLDPARRRPARRRLTLADLVTMQAGLDRTSGPNYGAWVSSRDWVAYALARPFVAEPGERMLYSTGSFHVLGAALARASGESLLALARGWLGRPLGDRDPGLDPRPAGLLPRRQRDGAVAARHGRLRRDVPPGRPPPDGARS